MLAPELPDDVLWSNTTSPLSIRRDLRGRVAVLWFFSPASIHCRSALQVLETLALRFADRQFALVGVVAPGRPAEQDPSRAALLLAQLGVHHPVALDPSGTAWRAFACQALPTLVLLDAEGNVRFQGAGEPELARLSEAVGVLLHEGFAQGTLRPGGLDAELEPPPPARALAFPSGLAYDHARGWLWIADSGHHRVVAIEPATGRIACIAGIGMPGAGDGTLVAASFAAPRGLALLAGAVYVADSQNHLLRKIDPDAGVVTTVVGRGFACFDLIGGNSAGEQGLAWPLALAADGKELWFANAGTHQLWRVDPAPGFACPIAGTGGHGHGDGDAELAALAHPSAVAVQGRTLQFLDAETGSLRSFDIESHRVTTRHPRKFVYPRGLVAVGDALFVADAGADAVLRCAADAIEPVLGPGDGLCGPEALATDGSTLWIADALSHRILARDLAGGGMRELALRGLLPPRAGQVLHAELRADSEVELRLHLPIPVGGRMADGIEPQFRLRNIEGSPLLMSLRIRADVRDGVAILRGIPSGKPCAGVIGIGGAYATCHDSEQVLHRQELDLRIGLTLAAQAPAAAEVSAGSA